MKQLAIAACLAAGLALASPADAQTLYTCGDGTVRSVQAVTENLITPTTHADADGSEKSSDTAETVFEKRVSTYLVTVQLYDMVYTGRSSADATWNLDPTLLATNEAILVCANDRQMVIDRLDGTDYRASIVSARPETSKRTTDRTR